MVLSAVALVLLYAVAIFAPFLANDRPLALEATDASSYRRARTSIPLLFVLSILVNVGMWFERFVIIVSSLDRSFLPSTWQSFSPTFWDLATLAGSFGLFLTLFCLFVRYLPIVAMSELKTVLPQPAAPSRGAGRTA